MSSLFRQRTVTYRTRAGQRCRADTPGAIRTEVESKKWYGEYRGPDGAPLRVPLSESKETARRMLSKLAGDSQLASVGIVDPFAESRERPLLDHLEDFIRGLAAKGNCAEHVAKTKSQAEAVLKGCRFEWLDDLQPSAVVEFLAELRSQDSRPALAPAKRAYTAKEVAALLGIRVASVWRMVRRDLLPCQGEGRARHFGREDVAELFARRRGVGVQTSNHYLAAVKHFTKWLVKDRRAPYDALACLSRLNTKVDVRVVRRVLPPDEFAAFVGAARAGRSFRGLTGADRAMIYITAAYSGLRASELASLSPTSFDLAEVPPTATVEAGYSKHRRKDVIILRPDLADMLRGYVAGKPRKNLLWPGTWTIAGAEMVRLDLEAAGVPYRDEAGMVYDFHALRHQFVSNLAAAGVHPSVAKELARHSDIRLTMNVYTHLGAHDLASALDKLPKLPGAPREKNQGQAS